MGCIEIFLIPTQTFQCMCLIETWDVLKFQNSASCDGPVNGLIETWYVLKLESATWITDS